MVLREQCVNRMEIEGITVVDLWKTYVSRSIDEYVAPILVDFTAGAGKSTLL